MQDVANLEITEGEVRTVHDSNNRLIWGKLNYDTKYEGDTSHAAYSGKNLLNMFTDRQAEYTTTSQNVKYILQSDGGVNIIGKNTSSTASKVIVVGTGWTVTTIKVPLDSSKTYYVSATRPSTDYRFFVRGIVNGTLTTVADEVNSSFTNCTGITLVQVEAAQNADMNGAIYIQIEENDHATPYEQYNGGTAAPNIVCPVPVKTVTGEQTITISDGVQSQSFKVNLASRNLFDKSAITNKVYINASGSLVSYDTSFVTDYIAITPNTDYYVSNRTFWDSIALYDSGRTFLTRISMDYQSGVVNISNTGCRYIRLNASSDDLDVMQFELGSQATAYQAYFTPIELSEVNNLNDYFYKNGSNWYVHKEIGKHVLDNSGTWSIASGTGYNEFTASNIITPVAPSSDTLTVSNHFSDTTNNRLVVNGTTVAARVPTETGVNTVTKFRTFLRVNMPNVYYNLATPTNTQVTDSTLISQLNAIHEWLVRYGYSGTVSGDLPIVISRTAL